MYPKVVARSGRLSVRNPFAVVLVSLATSVALIPLVSGLILGGVVGGLIGLWTTCLLLGVVGAGGARISVIIVERELSLGTDYFFDGVSRGRVIGPVVGFGTFCIILLTLGLTALPLTGIPHVAAILVGVYVNAVWYVIAMIALLVWASTDTAWSVQNAFRDAVDLVFRRPLLGVVMLVQSGGWFLLSAPLIIVPFVVTPGVVFLINAALVLATVDQFVEDADSRFIP